MKGRTLWQTERCYHPLSLINSLSDRHRCRLSLILSAPVSISSTLSPTWTDNQDCWTLQYKASTHMTNCPEWHISAYNTKHLRYFLIIKGISEASQRCSMDELSLLHYILFILTSGRFSLPSVLDKWSVFRHSYQTKEDLIVNLRHLLCMNLYEFSNLTWVASVNVDIWWYLFNLGY